MESIKGKIDSKRTETKMSQKTGKEYTKTFLKLGGVEYNQFGTTVAMKGDEVTLEFEVSDWGNDIKTLTAHTAGDPAQSAPRSGPKEKKSEKRPEKAAQQFEIDLQRIQARNHALDLIFNVQIMPKETPIELFLSTAEKVEDWIMRDTPKILESAHIDIIVDRIIDVVQASKDGKVPDAEIDKLFICKPETRDKAYIKAQASGQVNLLKGYWLDVARKG